MTVFRVAAALIVLVKGAPLALSAGLAGVILLLLLLALVVGGGRE